MSSAILANGAAGRVRLGRSAEGWRWRALYNRTRWHRLRARQLAVHPFCAMCAQAGRRTWAGVVDHIRPHKGDVDLFHDPANLQSLCASCHNSGKKQVEMYGYSSGVGVDGWPVDGNHPVYG